MKERPWKQLTNTREDTVSIRLEIVEIKFESGVKVAGNIMKNQQLT